MTTQKYDRSKNEGWAWLRYERTHWARENGQRVYIGHFRLHNDPYSWTEVAVPFWARRPIVAMRHICESIHDSAQSPTDFGWKDIN